MKQKKKDKKTDVSHMHDAEKTVLIQMLFEKINLLEDKIGRLQVKNKLLESRLEKDSKNSHKPPSSDQKGKKNRAPRTTSSRGKSNKKPGGQSGHKGSHLKMSNKPDKVVVLPIKRCSHCHKNLKRTVASVDTRQVFDIPEPKIWVTEYQAENKCCPYCEQVTKAAYPEGVTHKTQYGPRVRALMSYLNQYHFVPW